MGIKSLVVQCLKHSDFISALSMPEKFDFKNKSRGSAYCYDKIHIQTRLTLNDVSLIEGKPLMLFGNFIVIEEKNGCGSDLFFDVPNSSTSISVRGEFETTINIDGDLINMVTEFGGSGEQDGANRDNYRLHDPLYSKAILNGSLLDVFGQVKEVYKIADGKYTHASSISDNTETFDIIETEEQVFERDFFEIYPKGIISRDYIAEELFRFEERRESRMQRDSLCDVPNNYDSTDAYYFIEKEKPKTMHYIEERNKAREKKKKLIIPVPHKKEKTRNNNNNKRRY